MTTTYEAAPTVILAVTIVADTQRGVLLTTVEHTPEETRDEHGESFSIERRTFPRRVACPVSAARLLAAETAQVWPSAKLTLVNA